MSLSAMGSLSRGPGHHGAPGQPAAGHRARHVAHAGCRASGAQCLRITMEAARWPGRGRQGTGSVSSCHCSLPRPAEEGTFPEDTLQRHFVQSYLKRRLPWPLPTRHGSHSARPARPRFGAVCGGCHERLRWAHADTACKAPCRWPPQTGMPAGSRAPQATPHAPWPRPCLRLAS